MPLPSWTQIPPPNLPIALPFSKQSFAGVIDVVFMQPVVQSNAMCNQMQVQSRATSAIQVQ